MVNITELERNRAVVILNAWQRKPMRKAEIKNQPSCGDQILKYNILLIVTFLLLIISKKVKYETYITFYPLSNGINNVILATK